jgi:hypothetical protein
MHCEGRVGVPAWSSHDDTAACRKTLRKRQPRLLAEWRRPVKE